MFIHLNNIFGIGIENPLLYSKSVCHLTNKSWNSLNSYSVGNEIGITILYPNSNSVDQPDLRPTRR